MIMNIFLNKTNKGCKIVISKNGVFKQNINENIYQNKVSGVYEFQKLPTNDFDIA